MHSDLEQKEYNYYKGHLEKALSIISVQMEQYNVSRAYSIHVVVFYILKCSTNIASVNHIPSIVHVFLYGVWYRQNQRVLTCY